MISFADGLLRFLGENLYVITSEVGRLWKVVIFGLLVALNNFAELRGFSFSILLTDFICYFFGVILILDCSPLICLEILDISASKLVLFKIEFCPRSIYELVQSRKGFIYDTSSSVDFKHELLGVCPNLWNKKNLSNTFWSFDSCLNFIADNVSFNFMKISWLYLLN